MRKVYVLIDLAEKYGAHRLDEVCAIALEIEMHDMKRLERMLERGVCSAPDTRSTPPAPPARFARSADDFALRSRAAGDRNQGDPK